MTRRSLIQSVCGVFGAIMAWVWPKHSFSNPPAPVDREPLATPAPPAIPMAVIDRSGRLRDWPIVGRPVFWTGQEYVQEDYEGHLRSIETGLRVKGIRS